jgi:hypothetical protein
MVRSAFFVLLRAKTTLALILKFIAIFTIHP